MVWQIPYLQNNTKSFKRGGGAEERNNINFSPSPPLHPKRSFLFCPSSSPPFSAASKKQDLRASTMPKKEGVGRCEKGGGGDNPAGGFFLGRMRFADELKSRSFAPLQWLLCTMLLQDTVSGKKLFFWERGTRQ